MARGADISVRLAAQACLGRLIGRLRRHHGVGADTEGLLKAQRHLGAQQRAGMDGDRRMPVESHQ